MPNGEATNNCVLGNRNEANIMSLKHDLDEERIVRKAANEEQWETINRIANRPPVWATMLLSGLSAIAAAVGAVLATHLIQ